MNRVAEITETSIKGFFGPYRFLSNFHQEDFEYEGYKFPTSEHAFQFSKTTSNWWKNKIVLAPTPSEAKALGRKCPLRYNWNDVRYDAMVDVLRHKFFSSKNLMEGLLNTGNKYLEETNDWNDTYWGVCNGEGQNNLGKALMKVRAEIRFLSEEKFPEAIIGRCPVCGEILTRQNIIYPSFFTMYECPRCVHIGNSRDIILMNNVQTVKIWAGWTYEDEDGVMAER